MKSLVVILLVQISIAFEDGIQAESILTDQYHPLISTLASFALLTESQVISLYSQIPALYKFVLFYLLIIYLLYKALNRPSRRSVVEIQNTYISESSKTQIIEYLENKHKEIEPLLKLSQNDCTQYLDKIKLGLKDILADHEEFQEEIAQSHKDIWEELKLLAVSKPIEFEIIAPAIEYSPFPYISNKDRQKPKDDNYLVPPEHSIDSSDSYLPDEDSDSKDHLLVPDLMIEPALKIPQTRMPPNTEWV